nr:PREDICTED: uncharacterized protein LOC109041093 [Bemisia tabaci]
MSLLVFLHFFIILACIQDEDQAWGMGAPETDYKDWNKMKNILKAIDEFNKGGSIDDLYEDLAGDFADNSTHHTQSQQSTTVNNTTVSSAKIHTYSVRTAFGLLVGLVFNQFIYSYS